MEKADEQKQDQLYLLIEIQDKIIEWMQEVPFKEP